MNILLWPGIFLAAGGTLLLIIALDIDATYARASRRTLVNLASIGAAAACIGFSLLVGWALT